MANQALIQAAQRMYSSKATQTDLAPIIKGASSAISSVSKGVAERRAKIEEESKEEFKPINTLILENDIARPELTKQLNTMQDELYKAKVQQGGLRSKKKKEEAAEAENNITNKIQAFEEDFKAWDKISTEENNPSKANNLVEQANDNEVRDKSLVERLIYKDDGVYVKQYGEEVRLSKYKKPVQKYTQGLNSLVDINSIVLKAADKTDLSWENARPDAAKRITEILGDDNWSSLLFDEVDIDYVWSDQQLKQEFPNADPKDYDKNMLILKQRVKEDPEYYKKEFKEDVLRAYKIGFDEHRAQQASDKASKSGGSGRSRAPLSEARLAEINIFKNSLKRSAESGKDITFPSGEIGKITSSGNIQLYSGKGEKMEMLPISLDQALDRAKIPLDMRSDVKTFENKTSTKGGPYSQFKNK